MEATAVDKRLLDILCCPVSREPLRLLDRAELDALNRAAAAGELRSEDGSEWTLPISAALLTRSGERIYRIEDDIPVMLADLSIPARSVANFPSGDR